MSARPAETGTVNVEGGLVSGLLTDGVRSFRGIPYAAPPIGDQRWRPPAPVVPWRGVRDGTAFGAECPQIQYAPGSVYTRTTRQQSEDCLTLNVWTTASAGDRLPVFVWIHGGSLTRGSGISDVRDGTGLAKMGIVLVSMNYRLGALGFLAHPELSDEGNGTSGNYGILDQLAALEWVQRNIETFGGDPDNLTIGGNSAGAWSVNTLVASPLAKGLFVRAIAESGGRFTGTPDLRIDRGGRRSGHSVGLEFAKTLGATSLKELRTRPAGDLLDVAGFRTMEVVDGHVLPDEIKTIFTRGQQNPVPVIVGQNAQEMTSFSADLRLPSTLDGFRERARQEYGDLASEFERTYGAADLASAREALFATARDTVFSYHMREWARATSAIGKEAYWYLFSHVPPSPRAEELRAFHACELPYVFKALTAGDAREAGFQWTDADRRLSDQISRYWVNFIATGNPNGPDLPQWTAYNEREEAYLEFGDTIRSGTHLYESELAFQAKVLDRVR